LIKRRADNGEEERTERNNNQDLHINPENHNEGSSTTQVMETMRNLIVELHVFKVDNEKNKELSVTSTQN